MQDRRNELIEKMSKAIITNVDDPEEANDLINSLTIILSDYEIAERCTDLSIRSDANERLVDRYSSCMVIDGKSPKTIEQYRRALKKLSDFL